MWSERKPERDAVREMPSNAWSAWRQAAARVQTAWDDMTHARRDTRAAAYAEYQQALHTEEEAARELAASLGRDTALRADLSALAA